jgi:tetratricopeptide (TPR) repeat protein
VNALRSRTPWLVLALVVLVLAVLEPFAIQAAREAAASAARDDRTEIDDPLGAPGHHDHLDPYPISAYKLGAEEPAGAEDAGRAPLMGNLGSLHHPITTTSPLAQRYFDEGLVLAYGFNHERAIRAFQDALNLDPTCAMCYWGIAYSLGPNINAAMADAAVPTAHAAVTRASELAATATPRERAYIRALAARYAPKPTEDRAHLDLAYADAMRDVARAYPGDVDALVLYAEALMDLTPWKYWTKAGEPTEHTEEIVRALDAAMALAPGHVGANHFYIHAVEASRTPERALPSAERLETAAPGAGHLVHMPSHVYWRVGQYERAARMNEHAIHSDETNALAAPSVGGTPDQSTHTFYSLAYYPHNIHFLFAAAQMEGRSAVALDAARKLVARIPEGAYAQIPALEDFRPMVLFGLARFGQWDAILAEPAPAEGLRYTTGMWHWARGLAHLRQGRPEDAEAELTALAEIRATDAMREQMLASNNTAAAILEIAEGVLAGELALARGDAGAAIGHLERAVALQDDLAYMEPPAWYYPVRHNLGAALLQAGRYAEAEAVYREDLRQYPKNGWGLYGLAESLARQGKVGAAQLAREAFEQAWSRADVTLTASRF